MTSSSKQPSRKRSINSSASTDSTAASSSATATAKNRLLKRKLNKQKSNKNFFQKIAKALSLSQSTVQAVCVLCLAILTGMIWNVYDGAHTPVWHARQKDAKDDMAIKRFLEQVCNNEDDDEDVYCHPSLIPKRRTQMAIRDIGPGTRVLEIPRTLTIWDLDALRDDWIRQHVWGAKHGQTQNPLDSAAYLALYLALIVKGTVRPTNIYDKSQGENNNVEDSTTSQKNSSRLLQYLNECMPKQKDLAEFHPIFWDEQELLSLIRPHSATFAVVKAYRDMVRSEYQAFVQSYQSKTTEHLQDVVSEDEYRVFRVLVMSRSFGTGPLPIESSSSSDTSLSQEEMELYQKEAGIDMSKGCYSMTPILDFYDHHATPNVQYAYNIDRDAFIIQASNMGIAAGHEVVDTYGKFTDSHLFAKFGFTNGDGSAYSQANLATWHRVMDMDLKKQFSYLPMKGNQPISPGLQKALDKQREDIQRYLRFDDGYAECIRKDSDHPEEAMELKKLKSLHLTHIANHARRWNIVMLPRAPDSSPARASNIPITTKAPKVSTKTVQVFHKKEYHLVSATCRLISLTDQDYNGRAIDILKENLPNHSFLLESPLREDSEHDSLEAALEFRTHFCLARLASEALQRYDRTSADEEANVAKLSRDSFQSKEWTAAHLRLSEMQTLEALRDASFAAARVYEDQRNRSPAFTIHDKPCPVDGDK